MKARCLECGTRPARRRGLCVRCVRDDSNARHERTRSRKASWYQASALGTTRRAKREAQEEERRLHHEAVARWHAARRPTPEEERRSRAIAALVVQQQRDDRARITYQRNCESLDWKADVGHREYHEWFTSAVGASAADEFFAAEDLKLLETIADTPAARERAVAAGITGPSVTRRERERLRDNGRHRDAPPTWLHMSTKLKHRKPGHVSSAGGRRPERKPRRRWRRDVVVYDWKAAA